MFNRTASALVLSSILLAGVAGVFAQDAFTPPTTPEQAVKMRQDVMRQGGGMMRSIGNLSGAEAVAALTVMSRNFEHMPALFPEGSVVGDSEALPAIWENWESFTAITAAGQKAAEAGIAAAEAGDAAAYATAVREMMGTCGQCHQQFRS